MKTLDRSLENPTLKALADPVRSRICELLAQEELCVCHLADELKVSQPLLSHHLKTLRDAGLVQPRRHSYWTYYRLVPEGLADLSADLRELATRAENVTSARACGR